MPQEQDSPGPHAKAVAETVVEPEPDPKVILDHIAEVSTTARANWFGLLALLAFVGVSLMGHKDADFSASGAETQLPVIGLNVPVKSFFAVAPGLVAALYAYFHLYLMTLWNALADAPARIDGQPLDDRVFPWLISHAALWYRNQQRRGPDGRPEGSAAPRPLGWMVIAVSVVFGWLLGLVVLGLFWVRSLPAHDEWLTLWIALCFWLAVMVGWTGFRAACDRMAGRPREAVARTHPIRRRAGVAFAILLAIVSWETTEGSGILKYPVTQEDGSVRWRQIIPLYPTDLVNRHLTRKPSGWLPWHLWMEDFEERFRRREGIEPGRPLAGANGAKFTVEATERYAEYLSQLEFPDLRRADLRRARMSGTFLPGTNLRKASVERANLRRAEMQKVNLFAGDARGAMLLWAKLHRADLRQTRMQGAFVAEAELQEAQLEGADLTGAYLIRANLRGADCAGIVLTGALLHGADVTCDSLTQRELEGAVGDSGTVLPPGLSVATCLTSLPEEVEAALAYHPVKGDRFRRISRAEIRACLLCDANGAPRPEGSCFPQPDSD